MRKKWNVFLGVTMLTLICFCVSACANSDNTGKQDVSVNDEQKDDAYREEVSEEEDVSLDETLIEEEPSVDDYYIEEHPEENYFEEDYSEEEDYEEEYYEMEP